MTLTHNQIEARNHEYEVAEQNEIAEQNYIEKQLFQLAPLPLTTENYPFGFSLKIHSESVGKPTNYLQITPQQMAAIEQVLRNVV
jgi:carbamoylphosphate synthase small subunit